LANAARPTGIAAVYALLSSPQPKRMLTVYILAGFAWSCAVGILVVSALHGVNVEVGECAHETTIEAALYILAGAYCTAKGAVILL
jgi:hypothetical protein